MDAMVLAALKKWPNVPHCHGWLALDARGDWYLRDEAAQQAGPFPRIKGSRIEHRGLCDFIGRNYEADATGRWFFQNGPQRVYVQLEVTPWVWRLLPDPAGGPPAVSSHTGRPAGAVQGCWLDEQGRLFLATPMGFGLVHSLDMLAAAEAIEAGRWQPEALVAAEAPQRFGHVLNPQGAS
jgi:hypothetical protein